MASPEKQDDNKKTTSRSKKHLKHLKQDPKPDSSGSKLLECGISGSPKVEPEKQTAQNELHLTDMPQSKKEDNVNGTVKVSNNSSCKRKKAFPKPRRSYGLRSLDRSRVLRSKLDAAKCKTTMNPASNPEKLLTRKKRSRKKKVKKSGQDESSRILKHTRYMLNRMNYEQSLIDAYSGEGWKGQSAEKIRPEKELERAKSEILRCKLKIREIFQHLDSLLAEGRLQESLFDSDGIDCENIFCGKCGSKEVFADNDIILCDGICERGFHQKCLNPPLLSEDIPTGDEGWLCPQCDCKVDCIDLLNEFRGTDLSIEDSWERIFPEAAVLANGNGQYDDLNLPSEDSEDVDYDPNVQRVDVDEQEEGSSSKESDSSSSFYDSASSKDNMNQTAVELPTDDSEDVDYDPDVLDPEKEIQKSKSSSDESDFTSDSDEFCAEIKKISYAEEASASSLPSFETFVNFGTDEMKDKDKLDDYSNLPSAKLEIDKQESGSMSIHKRGRERLDYKKLYDEAYGKSSSDSSEDEEWNEKSSPKKLKKIDDKQFEVAIDSFVKKTPKLRKKNASSSAAEQDHGAQETHSSGCTADVFKKSGLASKRLYEAFQESQYPTREKKESLAQELDMTFQQVTKWFGNARHSARVSAKEPNNEVTTYYGIPTSHSDPDNELMAKSPVLSMLHKATVKKILDETFRENKYPSREKKEELAQELGMTFRQVSRWFETARHRSHASTKKSTNPATPSPNKVELSCRPPNSHEVGTGENEQTTEAFTPDKAIITTTTSTSNAKHDKGASPREEAATPKSRLSPWKPDYGIDSDSPIPNPWQPDYGIDSDSPIANGVASNEKGKKVVDDRQKAIAKELRRMRAGR